MGTCPLPPLTCASVGSGAEMETALLDYALELVASKRLLQWIDVPDILPLSTTSAWGVDPRIGDQALRHRMQYPSENAPGYCLSGTAGKSMLCGGDASGRPL